MKKYPKISITSSRLLDVKLIPFAKENGLISLSSSLLAERLKLYQNEWNKYSETVLNAIESCLSVSFEELNINVWLSDKIKSGQSYVLKGSSTFFIH